MQLYDVGMSSMVVQVCTDMCSDACVDMLVGRVHRRVVAQEAYALAELADVIDRPEAAMLRVWQRLSYPMVGCICVFGAFETISLREKFPFPAIFLKLCSLLLLGARR